MAYLYQLDVIERFIISIGGEEGVNFSNQIDNCGNRFIPDLVKKKKVNEIIGSVIGTSIQRQNSVEWNFGMKLK